MQRLTWIGLVLIALGLAAFVVPRIAFTDEQTVVDIGPLQIEVQQERSIRIPDIAAGAAVAAGTVLVVVGATRRD